MSKIPILVIAGPTASGKTALAIELAILYDGEIISADSMQIYKGMDIATAKPTKEEMKGIPHHLMGFLDRDKDFSVADYLALAREKIAEISNKGKLPVIAGGTGLYISSLLDNVKFDQSPGKSEIREKLLKETQELGREAMLQRLFEVDEETAKTLHPNNINRIIRALEVYELTGIKMSEHKTMSRCEESPYNACVIGLNFAQRELLYDRINKRVDIMVQKGLLEEAFANMVEKLKGIIPVSYT
ncbi:MAG: tRNA (adenosine(37)-N6)-dimethylallyltransferase MiaA, partial [Oscillospiraceae bacterium]|nr:tRNA (adenosine(37)-N6)-dimethylallyltransferase MiaA [Oscillospiraceae bacterium]